MPSPDSPTESAESLTESIDASVNSIFDPLATWLSDIVFHEVDVFGTGFPWIVAWLVAAGAVFSVRFGFVQFRHFTLALDLVRGRHDDTGEVPGEVNHFQALTAAVSGTVGLGNIAGVAVAVTTGGPGATFWMILCGLLGMATKFTECTLGVKYREQYADGTVSGGPMHYLRKGLADRGLGPLGGVLASLASLALLFFGVFGGNLFQVNQSYAQLTSVTGGDDGLVGSSAGAIVFGLVIAALTGLVLLGGIRSIAAVTTRLVPAMAGLYITACLIVILVNAGAVPGAIATVVQGAFAPEGVAGGALGALVIGFQRAAFSNEAGLGSAPIAHSAVRTRHPATEGLVSLLEPFIDTVVICTMTALTLVIASTPSWEEARRAAADGTAPDSGVALTSDAFATVLPWFPHVLTVAVLLFAFSTVITWGYYGLKAWAYLFGRGRAAELAYKVLYTAFAVLGPLLSLSSLIAMADAVVFLLAVINIAGLYLLAPVVKRELDSFLAHLRGGGTPAGEPDEDTPAVQT